MSKYRKIFHHVSTKDVKEKHLGILNAKELKEKNLIKEKEFVTSIMDDVKYSWRDSEDKGKTIREAMTTANVYQKLGDTSEDGELETQVIDTSLEASFEDGPDNSLANYMFSAVDIKDSGSGLYANGGFNIGKHLAFSANTNSDGSAYQPTSSRWAMLAPIDARNMDSITITAIRGNDQNGGELPDYTDEDLRISWYTTNTALWNQGEGGRWQSLKYDNDGTLHNDVEDIIIPIIPQGEGSSQALEFPSLRDWTIPIPEWCRRENVRFMLHQIKHSGQTYDHYGITQIKYSARTPSNAFVALDKPEASSFVRLGPSSSSSPKKRKKKIEDQLKAARQYTDHVLGKDFPGMGATLEDTVASPIGRDEVAQAHKDAGPLSQQLMRALGQSSPDPIGPSRKAPLKTDFSGIGDGGKEKFPSDWSKVSDDSLKKLFTDGSKDSQSAAVGNIISRELDKQLDKTKTTERANPLEKVSKAAETFARFLTNTLPKTIDNDYLGDKYVNAMIKNVTLQSDGIPNFGDNILGTAQKPVFDSKTNEIVIKYNYNFNDNNTELSKMKDKMTFLQKTFSPAFYAGLGKYSVDASPSLFRGIPVLGKVIDAGLGAVFSKAITTAEVFGGGKHVPGEFRVSVDDLAKNNHQFYSSLIANDTIPLGLPKAIPADAPTKPKDWSLGKDKRWIYNDETGEWNQQNIDPKTGKPREYWLGKEGKKFTLSQDSKGNSVWTEIEVIPPIPDDNLPEGRKWELIPEVRNDKGELVSPATWTQVDTGDIPDPRIGEKGTAQYAQTSKAFTEWSRAFIKTLRDQYQPLVERQAIIGKKTNWRGAEYQAITAELNKKILFHNKASSIIADRKFHQFPEIGLAVPKWVTLTPDKPYPWEWSELGAGDVTSFTGMDDKVAGSASVAKIATETEFIGKPIPGNWDDVSDEELGWNDLKRNEKGEVYRIIPPVKELNRRWAKLPYKDQYGFKDGPPKGLWPPHENSVVLPAFQKWVNAGQYRRYNANNMNFHADPDSGWVVPAPGYGARIGTSPDSIWTAEWRDSDSDGVDDRDQAGPGQDPWYKYRDRRDPEKPRNPKDPIYPDPPDDDPWVPPILPPRPPKDPIVPPPDDPKDPPDDPKDPPDDPKDPPDDPKDPPKKPPIDEEPPREYPPPRSPRDIPYLRPDPDEYDLRDRDEYERYNRDKEAFKDHIWKWINDNYDISDPKFVLNGEEDYFLNPEAEKLLRSRAMNIPYGNKEIAEVKKQIKWVYKSPDEGWTDTHGNKHEYLEPFEYRGKLYYPGGEYTYSTGATAASADSWRPGPISDWFNWIYMRSPIDGKVYTNLDDMEAQRGGKDPAERLRYLMVHHNVMTVGGLLSPMEILNYYRNRSSGAAISAREANPSPHKTFRWGEYWYQRSAERVNDWYDKNPEYQNPLTATAVSKALIAVNKGEEPSPQGQRIIRNQKSIITYNVQPGRKLEGELVDPYGQIETQDKYKTVGGATQATSLNDILEPEEKEQQYKERLEKELYSTFHQYYHVNQQEYWNELLHNKYEGSYGNVGEPKYTNEELIKIIQAEGVDDFKELVKQRYSADIRGSYYTISNNHWLPGWVDANQVVGIDGESGWDWEPEGDYTGIGDGGVGQLPSDFGEFQKSFANMFDKEHKDYKESPLAKLPDGTFKDPERAEDFKIYGKMGEIFIKWLYGDLTNISTGYKNPGKPMDKHDRGPGFAINNEMLGEGIVKNIWRRMDMQVYGWNKEKYDGPNEYKYFEHGDKLNIYDLGSGFKGGSRSGHNSYVSIIDDPIIGVVSSSDDITDFDSGLQLWGDLWDGGRFSDNVGKVTLNFRYDFSKNPLDGLSDRRYMKYDRIALELLGKNVNDADNLHVAGPLIKASARQDYSPHVKGTPNYRQGWISPIKGQVSISLHDLGLNNNDVYQHVFKTYVGESGGKVGSGRDAFQDYGWHSTHHEDEYEWVNGKRELVKTKEELWKEWKKENPQRWKELEKYHNHPPNMGHMYRYATHKVPTTASGWVNTKWGAIRKDSEAYKNFIKTGVSFDGKSITVGGKTYTLDQYITVTEDDEKWLNNQQNLVNATKWLGNIGLPTDFAQWAINYARGDMAPITEFSPTMAKQTLKVVENVFKRQKEFGIETDTVDVGYTDWGFRTGTLALGRFSATKLPDGTYRITDTFNVDKTFTTVGQWDWVPGLQETANRITEIAHKRRNIRGGYDEGGIPIEVILGKPSKGDTIKKDDEKKDEEENIKKDDKKDFGLKSIHRKRREALQVDEPIVRTGTTSSTKSRKRKKKNYVMPNPVGTVKETSFDKVKKVSSSYDYNRSKILDELVIVKPKQKSNVKVVQEKSSDWREEIVIKEVSDWTPVPSSRPTMSTSQTFLHATGAFATFNALGGPDAHPDTVTVTSYGETFPVDAPTISEIPIQGHASPIDPWKMARKNNKKSAKQTNAQLDASEKATKMASGAAEIMKGRVEDNKNPITGATNNDGVVATSESLARYNKDMKKYENEKKIWQEKYDKAYNEYQKKYDAVKEHNRIQFKTRYDKLGSFVTKYGLTIGKGFGHTLFTDIRLMKNPDYKPGKSGPDVPPQIVFVFSGNKSAGLEFSDKANVRIMYPRKKNGAWLPMEHKNVKGKGYRTGGDLGKYGNDQAGRAADIMITNTGSVGENIDFNVNNLQQEPQFTFTEPEPVKPYKPATINLLQSASSKKYIDLKKEILAIPDKYKAAGKLFLGYLTGTLPKKIDNSFFGEKAVFDAFSRTYLQNGKFVTDKGGVGMSNVLGSTQLKNLTVDENEVVHLKFEYDFKKNVEEWAEMETDGRFDDLAKAVNRIFSGNDKTKPYVRFIMKNFSKLGDMIVGGNYGGDSKIPFTGHAIQIAKWLGKAKPTFGTISIPFNDLPPALSDTNPDFWDHINMKRWEIYANAEMEMEFDPNQLPEPPDDPKASPRLPVKGKYGGWDPFIGAVPLSPGQLPFHMHPNYKSGNEHDPDWWRKINAEPKPYVPPKSKPKSNPNWPIPKGRDDPFDDPNDHRLQRIHKIGVSSTDAATLVGTKKKKKKTSTL